jgi:phosphoribosylanthranilate isomerase
MAIETKICGINSAQAMTAAIDGEADFVGLVFYPPSPRYVGPDAAAALCAPVPERVVKVGLFVDIDDTMLDAVLAQVSLDLLQLHGAETPERVREIAARTGVAVMKAIKVETAADVAGAEAYAGIADRLLFDAKAPAEMTGALPGGNALNFDWRLLAGRHWDCPWMLSGGLNADNLAAAVRISGAGAVDVSSGVEDVPGVKSAVRIAAFLACAKAL